ncbi:MAG: 50S ribosome-binding GTPase [Deltaproteobacteria bacterium]|jgi:tRNA modification GTPase|nr:50S ribosome-binding GTPase [Deltaproteobacteria bacterium]
MMSQPDFETEDTIIAEASPGGTGAISILRICGDEMPQIASRLGIRVSSWQPGKTQLLDLPGYDQVMAVFFKAPHSYTGENILEIFCHGSPIIVDRFIDGFCRQGARMAEPGEFTWRAVLNGKMTIDEAERINRRIHSRSLEELEIINKTPDLKSILEKLLAKAREALVYLETEIEFQEESAASNLRPIEAELEFLLNQGEISRQNRNLPGILLYGPPNCGKSTLFNYILGYSRALVSKIPGTTRDYIEAELKIRGRVVRLLDSAGMRDSTDEIEKAGVSRTRDLVKNSDVVIHFGTLQPDFAGKYSNKTIPVQGKADLPGLEPDGLIGVSGKTGLGVNKLLDQIIGLIKDRRQENNWQIWISERFANQLDLLHNIFKELLEAPLPELKAEQMKVFINQITGYLEQPPQDLYGEIFSRFCIGK